MSIRVLSGCSCVCLSSLSRSSQGVKTMSVLSLIEALSWTDDWRITPLHTGLDEGKWPFNRHDSHYDWELCLKASTLPASKAIRRLWSASSSPVAVVILVCRAAMLLLQCLSPHGILRTGLYVWFCFTGTSSSIAFDCSLNEEVMQERAWLVKV